MLGTSNSSLGMTIVNSAAPLPSSITATSSPGQWQAAGADKASWIVPPIGIDR